MTAEALLSRIDAVELVARTGRVNRILPTAIEASGPGLPLGALCRIETRADGPGGRSTALAEVVGVNRDCIVLAPFEARLSTFAGALVVGCEGADSVPVGDAFLGRAIDGLGRPIDGRAPIRSSHHAPLYGVDTSALARKPPAKMLETGVRAIDGLLTLGRGQRVGVFAASGVGKTSLMAQIAQQVDADRCVVCLVGERGHEVDALWNEALSPAARERTTLVTATSDQAAALRVRACQQALALAEYWRGQGQHVLLLLDSVTRLAMALREIGLAAGEPPTVRAYTPGVFAAIPRLVERCGALKAGGSITAVMTVLSETDDVEDPLSEMMKSLLDGHIILSRTLAEQGHYPAIDIPRSISRSASRLIGERQRAAAVEAHRLVSTYESARTLIETGVYSAGADADIDRAIELRPKLNGFLRQPQDERVGYAATSAALSDLLRKAG